MTVETLPPARYGQLQHVEQKIIKQASNNKQTNLSFYQAELQVLRAAVYAPIFRHIFGPIFDTV
jgi:hypothetical protein